MSHRSNAVMDVTHLPVSVFLHPHEPQTRGRPRGDGRSEKNQSSDCSHASRPCRPSALPLPLPQIRRVTRSPPRRTMRHAVFLAESQGQENRLQQSFRARPPYAPPLPPTSSTIRVSLPDCSRTRPQLEEEEEGDAQSFAPRPLKRNPRPLQRRVRRSEGRSGIKRRAKEK